MAEEGAMARVDEFLRFWSAEVDSSSLVFLHGFFEALAKAEVLKGKAALREAIVETDYTSECAQSRVRPAPDQCNLVTTNDIASLEKMAFVATLANDALLDTEKK